MTATYDFDRLLGSVLRERGPQTADETVIDAAVTQARDLGQRRPLVTALDRRAWPAPRISIANPVGARLATLALVALLTLAIIAASLFIGSLLPPRQPVLPGAWTHTSQPGTQRDSRVDGFGMAVMPDGRVLLVGGVGPDPASAEIYDPATDLYAPAAKQMVTTPDAATAVALHDGSILVFGTGSSATFDPIAQTFAPQVRMIADRVFHTTTMLSDGRVLVVGGSNPGGGAMLASAEVYDASSASWSPVGSLQVPRQQHTATLLADGHVLITGGITDDDAGSPLDTAELFDPSSGRFTPAGMMIGGRAAHTATLLRDGRVLVAGGTTDGPSGDQASAELYDPVADRFLATGSLVTGRYEHAALALADGRVLVAGGSNDRGNPLSAEIYSPATGTFSVAASASDPHVGPIVRLADGRVLIGGGQPEVFDPLGQTPVARPSSRPDRTFTVAATPSRVRTDHSAIRLRDGRVLIIGGHGEKDSETSAEIYDPTSATFSPTGSMSISRGRAAVPRERSAAFLLQDGRVVVTGGARYEWDVEIYDPGSRLFSSAGSIATTGGIIKRPVTAVQLADGRIIVFGPPAGLSGDASEWGSVGIYELDPIRGAATLRSEIHTCDAVSDAAALTDGRVLVICYGPRSWLELVDVDTGRASVLDDVLGEDAGPLLRLPDGRIAFSMAVGAKNLSVLDPTTGQVSPTNVPIAPTGIPELTLLADGRVLVTGGSIATMWAPVTGVTTALPRPVVERFGHTATVLEDGRVLIVGGAPTPPDTATPLPAGAELFDPTGL